MRGGEDDELEFLPDADTIKEWHADLELEEFNEQFDLNPMAGFFSSQQPVYFFTALHSLLAKKNTQSEQEESSSKEALEYSELNMDDTHFEATFTISSKGEEVEA